MSEVSDTRAPGHPDGTGGQYIVRRPRDKKEPWASFPHRIPQTRGPCFPGPAARSCCPSPAAPWVTAPHVPTAGGSLLPGHRGPGREAPGAARPRKFPCAAPTGLARPWYTAGGQSVFLNSVRAAWGTRPKTSPNRNIGLLVPRRKCGLSFCLPSGEEIYGGHDVSRVEGRGGKPCLAGF